MKAAVKQLMKLADSLCHERGVRFTQQRKTVLQIISENQHPITAYEILEALQQQSPGIAPPTIYRALEFLQQQGFIHKLETQHSFVSCQYPEHDHMSQFLICSDCGDVTEIEDTSISNSLQKATRETGFTPRRRVVEVIGVCAECTRN